MEFSASDVAADGSWVTCVSPASDSGGTFVGTVPVDVSLNGAAEDFTTSSTLFAYEELVHIARVEPPFGPVAGNTHVQVIGGKFKNYSSELLCRFGDSITNAEYVNENRIDCPSPYLGSVDEVQTVSVFSMAWAPEIQSIIADVSDYYAESHTIRTAANAGTPQGEVQTITLSADDVNEVQTITTGVDVTGDVKLEVALDVQASRDEVQTLMTTVTPIQQHQRFVISAFADSSTAAGNEGEVLTLVAVSTDLSNNVGSFDITYNSVTSNFAVATVSNAIIASQFNTAFGLTVSSSSVSDSGNTRTWSITYSGSHGNVAQVTLSNGAGLSSSPVANTVREGSKQEVITITVANSNTGVSTEYWRLSLDGGTTWSSNLPHDATAHQVELAILEFSPSVVGGIVDVTFNNGATSDSYVIVFVNSIGDVPDMSFDWTFSGGTALVSANEDTKGTSYGVSGSFRLQYGSTYTSAYDVSSVTEAAVQSDIVSAISSVSAVTVHIDKSFFPAQLYINVIVASPAIPTHLFVFDDVSLASTRLGVESLTVSEANVLSGGFRLFTGLWGTPTQNISPLLSFDVSDTDLAMAIENLNASWTGTTVTKTAIDTAYKTNQWVISFPPATGNVDLLQVAAMFRGEGAQARIDETVQGSVVEIQKVTVTGTSDIKGNYTLELDGYRTPVLEWNSSAIDFENALKSIDSVGTVQVVRAEVNRSRANNYFTLDQDDDVVENSVMPIDEFKTYEYTVTFTSHVGDVSPMLPCCDENNMAFRADGTQRPVTLFSQFSEDAEVLVEEVRKGTGEKLSGEFTITVDAAEWDSYTTIPLPVTASAQDVEDALSALPVVADKGNGVTVTHAYTAQENNAGIFEITLSGFQDAANATTTEARLPVNVTVNSDLVRGNAATLVSTVTTDWSRKEVRKIDAASTPSGSTITCSVGSNSFAFSAASSASVVEAQIQGTVDGSTGLPVFGDVVVSRSKVAPYSWSITFAEVAQVGTLSCDNSAAVSVLQEGTSVPVTAGTFKLAYKGVKTGAIPYNAAASTIRTELESLVTIGAGNVLVTVNNGGNSDMNGGYSWDVVFSGSTVEGNVASLTVSDKTLTGTNSFVSIVEKTPGNEVGGAFRVKLPVARTDYSTAEWSPYIGVDASSISVKRILEQMDFVDLVSVSKSVDDAQKGHSYTISFAHYVGNSPTGFVPKTARDLEPMIVDKTFLTGVNVDAAITTNQDGTDPVSKEYMRKGFRIVTPGGSRTYPMTQRTRWLSPSETAESMRKALADATGMPSGFTVDRLGPFEDGGFEWTVTLPKGQTFAGDTLWVVDHGGAQTNLYPDGSTVTCSLKRLASFPLTGTFTLTFNGKQTNPLQHDASSDDVRNELLALTDAGNPNEIGDLLVSTHSVDYHGSGSNARRWDVTFTSLKEAGDVPAISATANFATGTNANITVKEQRKGVSSIVQKLVVEHTATNAGYDATTHFVLGFNSTKLHGGIDSYYLTSQIPLGASATVVQEALATIHRATTHSSDHSTGGVVVEKFSLADRDEYYVLFTDNNRDEDVYTTDSTRVGNVDELIQIQKIVWCDSTQTAPCNDDLKHASIHASYTSERLGGTFSLGYGEDCFEKFKAKYTKDQYEVICSSARTVELPFNASAAQVEAALEDLPAIVDVFVTRTHDVDDLQDHKIPVLSGVVSTNYNYHIHFREVFLNMTSNITEFYFQDKYNSIDNEFEGDDQDNKDEFLWTGGDLPSLTTFGENLRGTPTTDHALLHPYNVKSFEVVKGVNLDVGGTVAVEISQNGGVDFTKDEGAGDTTVTFQYLPVGRVTGLKPSHGPRTGFTEVVVYGENFKKSSSLTCRFGSTSSTSPFNLGFYVTPAVKFLSESAVICLSPPFLKKRGDGDSSTVYVEVSNNGAGGFANFTESNTMPYNIYSKNTVFTYDEPAVIHDFYPRSGPLSGNFSVKVFGGPFVDTDELRCRFGDKTVIGMYLSTDAMQCYAPKFAQSGGYPLEISLNDQDYTSQLLTFDYYEDIRLSRVFPVHGPAVRVGTEVNVYGNGFRNVSTNLCRFGLTEVPATFVSDHQVVCETPPLHPDSGGLRFLALSEQYNRYPDPAHGHRRLFPDAHFYPLYNSRLVSVEVTNNAQDYTDSGITYLYQDDAVVTNITNDHGPVSGGTPIFISGMNFVNSTNLVCRIGHVVVQAVFITRDSLMCFTPVQPFIEAEHGFLSHQRLKDEANFPHANGYRIRPPDAPANHVYVEVSNNNKDFTVDRKVFKYSKNTEKGKYNPGNDDRSILECPRGAYCADSGLGNFTLCPRGTYQPMKGQDSCLRCPIGYMCPEEGLHVPRICAAGFVCDVTGIEVAEQPCPEGHFCLQGTATSATTCGHPILSSELFPSLSLAEKPTTIRQGREPEGFGLLLGARNTACWNNNTADFGIQTGDMPARVWAERHLLPLDTEASFEPIRGRFCLDDSCMKLEDADDMSVTDVSFDYSSQAFSLRRPVPCPEGMYCHPGTAVNTSRLFDFTTPQPCSESMYCPEGSIDPLGSGECPRGFYCPFGKKIPCPVGTYCPRDGHWDPLPCPPGTFNAMTGQLKCSSCPRGYICPSFGRLIPAVCPPGFACSRDGLISPNTRCPPGFFCPNGTVTSDPFRNDTTLRPYPCSPGSYCLGGVGYDEVRLGDFMYAQPCTEGFYCELASVGPKGSGLCPAGFLCPAGTSNPIPTPRGYFAASKGTVQAAACLPGYYAPTVQTEECYPCPPGTTCEVDGLFEAEICPPGTYRSTLGEDGLPCAACPQGTWSKNWQMREKGECTRCPTGVVCPVEGMTQPCGRDDLPKPFEPVVNLNGLPVPEYEYPNYDVPPSFTLFECLKMNTGYTERNMDPYYQQFFYGELVPPYIDVLGRGAHFRSSSTYSLLYQTRSGLPAKCYRNTMRYGSILYQRISDYYGPQYDIQMGYGHQGYGNADKYNKVYTQSPPTKGYDPKLRYFHGEGTVYIDLPHARKFEPTYNCTTGIRLMDEMLNPRIDSIVYTAAEHDSGGYDFTMCPYLDEDLGCFVDPSYTLHAEGECCFIQAGTQRAIGLADDEFYPGTCESDRICVDDLAAEAEACSEGYVCDESTTTAMKNFHICREGYYCDFGTTPDPNLEAPRGQFSRLCPPGHYCNDGTGLGQAYRFLCPEGYFCPTGTGNPFIGAVADDALNRRLSVEDANPYRDQTHLKYLADDEVRVVSDHERRCFNGIDIDLKRRYEKEWRGIGENMTNSHLVYLRELKDNNPMYQNSSFIPPYQVDDIDGKPEGSFREYVINKAIKNDLTCARDNKWKLIGDTVERLECDCLNQLYVVAAVYRLWQCTSDSPLENLGLGSVSSVNLGTGLTDKANTNYNGKRDFWFDRTHLDKKFALQMDETLLGYGLKFLKEDGQNICEWPLGTPDDPFQLDKGHIPRQGDGTWYSPPLKDVFPPEGNFIEEDGKIKMANLTLDANSTTTSFKVKFTWTEYKTFSKYSELKAAVHEEYVHEIDEMNFKDPTSTRTSLDPYIFDLNYAVRMVEEFGADLPKYIYYRQKEVFDSAAFVQKISKPGAIPTTVEDFTEVCTDGVCNTLSFVPGRLDTCECQNIYKCPNGTTSSVKSMGVDDCTVPEDVEVLRRVSVIPNWYWMNLNATYGEYVAQRYHDFQDYRVHGQPVEKNAPSKLVKNAQKYQNATDFDDLGNIEKAGDSIGTLKLETGEVAVFTLNLTGLPNNMTYNDHYRVSLYVDCKPCPNRYTCTYADASDLTTGSCSSPDYLIQDENFNKCLKRERKTVCVSNTSLTVELGDGSEEKGGCLYWDKVYNEEGYYPAGHPNNEVDDVTGLEVITAIPQQEIDLFNEMFLVYQEPDLNKCINTPYYCEDKNWEYMTWIRVCNDDDANPDYYDCNEVLMYDNFKRWADEQCCTESQSKPSKLTCNYETNTCQDPDSDDVDYALFTSLDFYSEYDYYPPPQRRQGRLVMDRAVQEAGLGQPELPFEGFYKWHKPMSVETNAEAEELWNSVPGFGPKTRSFNSRTFATQTQMEAPFEMINVLVGNRPLIAEGKLRKWHEQTSEIEPRDNQFWFKTPGCCQCVREPMPSFFTTNREIPGYPDDKHQLVQFTAQALTNIDVTPVVELVHGKYYPAFDDYFGEYDRGEMHVHTPQRFEYDDVTHTNNMWLAVLEEPRFDGSDNPTSIELPFNLPVRDKDTPIENRILLSRPSDITVGDASTTVGSGGLDGYMDRTYERIKQTLEIEAEENFFFLEENVRGEVNFTDSVQVPIINIDPEGRQDELNNEPKSVRDPLELVSLTSLWWNSGDKTPYFDASGSPGPDKFDFLALPYFPFFSNCEGYDSYMSISRLIEEHPDCEYIDYKDTLYVDPYPWFQLLTPESDTCRVFVQDDERFDPETGEELTTRTERGIYLKCQFEESIETAAGGLRWYEAEADTVLYRLSKYPMSLQDSLEPSYNDVKAVDTMLMEYGTSPNYGQIFVQERWGRRAAINELRNGYLLVDVSVHSEATGMKNCIPRQVRFRIEYYQQEKGLKTLVSADMIYNNLCTTVKPEEFGGNAAILTSMSNYGYEPCPVDIKGNLKDYDYRLEFEFYALNWAELLNKFEFQAIVYIMFFTLVGLMSVMNAALIWGVNRLLTKLRHPPAFHAMTLVTIVADAPIFGCCLASIPYLFTIWFTKFWFAKNEDGGFHGAVDPESAIADSSDLAFEAIPGDWLDTLALTNDRIDTYRVGRTGTGLMAIGLYTTVLGTSLLVPDWMDEHIEDNEGQLEYGNNDIDDDEDEPPEPSPVWTPMLWKRSHLIWGSMCLEAFLLVIWEFSYSALFEDNVYVFIMVFKTIQMIMDVFMGDMLREHLMNAPLVVVIEVSEILVTMGASDFMDFTFSYFVELSVMIIERLYLDPALKTGWKLLPRWKMIFRRKFAKRKRLTRAQKQAEELEWRRINEEIELESEGIEPLLDSYGVYSVEITGGILSPFINYFLIMYFNETQMPVNYGIRQNEMQFYTIFAVYMIPYSFLMDMFILNSQELIHGWKVYDYVSYQRYRFSTREQRWMLRSETLDESIAEGMQTLDLMCFSSQYYFLLSIFSLGMLNMMFATTIFLRTDYAIFGDPVMPLIFMLWFLLCEGLKRFLVRMADVQVRYFGWRGLWKTKQIEGTVDDDVAAKLAIGEGRQADLEQERLELQALNSERFRHRFLERNRPWILQHLVELLTPRSLEGTGPDGRPVVEYIRDVYAELMAMGEGARKPGDRSDVSSDEEDELEDMRREWPRAPLQGPSLAIARLWLEKARKRRAFNKLVTGIIQSHKEAACNVCSRNEDNGAILSVGLATNGEFDQYAIDRLIGEFEQQYSVNEKDPNLWKAFFRSKAQYITRCNYCLDRLEQERLKREAKLPGAGRPTRPDDISSDEEDDEVVFDQVFVTSASNEGKMMSKWLTAARKRIGGVFPRPDARKQMERHAERMRKRKLEGGKAKIAGMDDVDAGQEELKKKWEVELNAASKALAIRWLRLGRDSVGKKFRSRGDELREGVMNHVSRMPEEDDWFFGAALRIEGMNLQEDGSQLMLDRRSLEADEAVKVRKIQVDYVDFEKEKQKVIDDDRRQFEQKMAEAADRVQIEVELRTRELNRLKEERKKENDITEQTAREEEGAVSSEMMEAHRNSIIEIEELIANEQTRAEMAHAKVEAAERAVYDRKEQLAVQTITDRRIMAADNVQRIQRETMAKIKSEESNWQSRASRWLGVARRKVELKEIEDAEQQTQKRRRKRRG